ncbi:RNA-guided endonuclease TnpB family protein [Archaeoglobus sp.]
MSELEKVRKSFEEGLAKLDQLIEQLKAERDRLQREIEQKLNELKTLNYIPEELESFLEEPYLIMPKKKDEFYFLHKLSRYYVDNYDVICVENLDVKDLVENGKSSTLNRHILDSSWAKFLSLLAYKAERAGRRVESVKPTNTSKRCAKCGYIMDDLTLSDRWFTCPKCGWEADRDYNASLNIRDVGLGRSRMPVEGEPLPLVIPYRKVIEGLVLSVKREAPCVSEG